MRWLALLLLLAPCAASEPEAATNATVPGCQPLPSWGPAVGIAMGSIASIGINIGQNLQADGLRTLPEEIRDTKPFKSKLWRLGMAVFVTCSMANFAALALAPASVLVPLESIQFVTNVAYSKFVSKAKVPPRMLLGVTFAVIGTVLSVVFGASGDSCHTQEQLEWAWRGSVGWYTWVVLSLVVALACLRINIVYTRRVERGENPWQHKYVRPVTFTLSAALLGGSQMIVQSKVFSELLAMLFQGVYAPWLSWLSYLALVLTIACGILWVVKLTTCLGIFDPLLILPLMVATYILFGGIAGGIYFREFDTLHLGMAGWGGWPLYISGLLFVLLGLYCIATAGIRMQEEGIEAEKAKQAMRKAESNHDPKALWGKLKVAVALQGAMNDALQAKQSRAENCGIMPGKDVADLHPVLIVARGASKAVRRMSGAAAGAPSSEKYFGYKAATGKKSVNARSTTATMAPAPTPAKANGNGTCVVGAPSAVSSPNAVELTFNSRDSKPPPPEPDDEPQMSAV